MPFRDATCGVCHYKVNEIFFSNIDIIFVDIHGDVKKKSALMMPKKKNSAPCWTAPRA